MYVLISSYHFSYLASSIHTSWMEDYCLLIYNDYNYALVYDNWITFLSRLNKYIEEPSQIIYIYIQIPEIFFGQLI